MPDKPISHYFAPTLLVITTALAAANWYLRPERAWAWASVVLLAGVALVALVASRRSGHDGGRGRAGGQLRSGIVFAGLMLVIPLGMALATALGATRNADLAYRATMVLTGGFFVVTGNSMPKVLTPLLASQCDAARAQAFRRAGGWTWVLTGLVFATAWLVLPLKLAEPVSLTTLIGGLLVVAGYAVRLCRR